MTIESGSLLVRLAAADPQPVAAMTFAGEHLALATPTLRVQLWNLRLLHWELARLGLDAGLEAWPERR